MDQAQHAVQYLSHQVEELKTEIKEKPKKLKQKRVHDLRVALHRIRSLLEMTSLETTSLKKLDKSLGKVRDLDVAIKNAKKYGLSVSRLKKRRKQYSKDAIEFLKDSKKRLCKDLDKSSQKFEENLDLKSTAGKLKSSLTKFDHHLKDDELHQVRIGLKKIRYLLESTGKSVERLTKIQQQLGEVHDLEVLSEFYKKNPHLQNDRRIMSLTAKKTVKPVFKQAAKQLNGLTH